MAEGMYSLLGRATTSDYQRRKDEERKFRKDLRKDQMKAMLLNPLIGAAATTGMEAVGDFLGDRFLEEGGKNFLDTEKGYALSNKLTAIRSQQAELKTEYDSLNKADAYKTMVERLANEKIQQLGLKPGDTEATFIKQDFASEAQRANILKGIEETKADLLKQMTLLGKAPTNKELLSRLQNRKFYYGKGKISKLFSTGFNKVLGRDMDEIKARGLNYLLTGSEDEDRTTIIAEALKNSDNTELNQLALNSRNLMFADDQFVRNLLVGIEAKNPDFYNRLRARVGDNKDEFIRQNKLFENFYLQDHENYGNYVPEGSFIESYVNTEKALKARKDLNFDAFRQGMSEHLFRDYQEGTKGWIKSQRLSKENTDKFEAVYKRLGKDEGKTSDTIAQKQKVINEGIEETYQHSLATFRSFISNGDPRVKALSAASEEDIKAALNKFAYETQIQIDPDNEYAQVFLSVENEEQERIRFANTLDNIMDDERYKTATGQAKIQFEKNFQGVLKDLGYDSIDDVSNNLILSSKGKRDLLNKAVTLTIDTFKTDKNLGSYKIDAIGAQARTLQKNINNIFPDDSPRVPQTTLNIGLEASRKKFIADQDRKLNIRNTLTAGADTKKSLLIGNALVRAGYDLSDQGVIDAVGGRDKLTSLLARKPTKDLDTTTEEETDSPIDEEQRDYVPNQTLGKRLNNPLNVRDNAANDWKGLEGKPGESGEKGYAKFTDKKFGYRAADKVLEKYATSYSLNTVEDILNRFAPKNENPTQSYINFVSDRLNVAPNERLQMSSRQVRAELLAVMAEFESKAEDSPADVLSMIRQANLVD